ncbi:MAG: hypothetical protein ACE5JX_21095 [Acidobacteriota bacterium]
MRVLTVSFLVWVALVPLSSSVVVAGNDQEVAFQRKLAAFEKRLRELEARQAKKEGSAKGELVSEVREMRRQLDLLAEEVEKLRSGEAVIDIDPEKARSLGLGPSAAAVYRKAEGTAIAGYGEMLYQNFGSESQNGLKTGATSELDFVRAIIYYGYRFSDKFVFNSEVELEHTDETSLEFAYVDYQARDHFSLRGGLLLMPMGLINEFHEPNVFLGATRPETERRIIPTTWRENGFGVVGSTGRVNYRAYLVNGLDAGGFSAAGLRKGRQKGSQAHSSDFAFVGRLDVNPTPGVFFGGSLYVGDSGQGRFEFQGRQLDVRTTIGELHGQAQFRGWDLRGLYARATVDDAAELTTLLGLSSPIADTLQGWYLQVGYNILAPYSAHLRVTPYYRFERLDTQSKVPAGFLSDPDRDQTFHTLGFEFRPLYNIVVKTDYQWLRNEAKTGVNQFNIALGYSF